jgi:dTDP-4-dehydrorhamnose reductase
MDQKSILIIGANGQLGKALQIKYPDAQKSDLQTLDISNAEQVASYDWSNTHVVLNSAAYTNVDGAETAEGRISAWQANASAVRNLTKAAIDNDFLLVHISTDYVFDGSKDLHSEDEAFSPLSVYGESKAAGDIAVSLVPKHYVLRTSWVIGDGNNFVRTMLELGRKGVSPKVVSDQLGRLTFTGELVRAIDHLLESKVPYGTYNVSGDGDIVSWSDITREIFKLAQFNLQVIDVTTAEYYKDKEGIAPRPLHSALDLAKVKATGLTLNDWHKDLSTYISKEQN